MSLSQKRKLLFGKEDVNHIKFQELWKKENPDGDFETTFTKEVWKWMNVWVSLKTKEEGLYDVAQAFAEKITRANKNIRKLEERIRKQKTEIKRLTQLKAQAVEPPAILYSKGECIGCGAMNGELCHCKPEEKKK